MNKNILPVTIALVIWGCTPDVTVVNELEPEKSGMAGTAGMPIVDATGGAAGAAGMTENNARSTSTAGAGGEGGSPCIPITCEEYATQQTGVDTEQACGIIEDDGCGKPLDCGDECNEGKTCGGKTLEQEDEKPWNWVQKYSNICGGGCKLVNARTDYCEINNIDDPRYELVYGCAEGTTGIPFEACKPVSPVTVDGVERATAWCCISDGDPYEG